MARAVGTVPTQADKRRSMTLTDQHGRKWFAVIEKESGAPTGLVQPMFQVPDPALVVPQKYQTFPEDQPGKLIIDYAGWHSDAEASEKEWMQNRAQLVTELPGGLQNPMLFRYLGPKPLSPRVVRAMEQGNRWALGYDAPKPPEAEEYFPTPAAEDTPAVFSETAPVFSEPEPESVEIGVKGAMAQNPGKGLAEIMAEVEKRCPSNLFGAAKRNWCLQELERMAAEPANG